MPEKGKIVENLHEEGLSAAEALTSPTLLSPWERREKSKKDLGFSPLSPLGREGLGE